MTATRPLTVGPADIAAALPQFVGEIAQRPPAFSAVQVGGRRAYDLARRGAAVELPARPVRIARLTVLGWQAPDLTLEVTCGPGTYIRSLARDLGAALGCGGHLIGLVRTRSGGFSLAAATTLADLEHHAARCTWHSLLVAPSRRVGAPPGPDRHPARRYPAAAGPACLLGPSAVKRTGGNPHGRPRVCTRCRGPADCHCGLRSAAGLLAPAQGCGVRSARSPRNVSVDASHTSRSPRAAGTVVGRAGGSSHHRQVRWGASRPLCAA